MNNATIDTLTKEVGHLRKQLEDTERKGEDEQRRLVTENQQLKEEKQKGVDEQNRLQKQLDARPAAGTAGQDAETQRRREEDAARERHEAAARAERGQTRQPSWLEILLGVALLVVLAFGSGTWIAGRQSNQGSATSSPAQQQTESPQAVSSTYDFSDL